MGLDCTAYSNLEPVTGKELLKYRGTDGELPDDWAYDNGFIQVYRNEWAPRSYRGIPDDLEFYRKTDDTEEHSWRAGSYGGYNRWREGLANTIRSTTSAIWESPDEYVNTPFFDLINFSDCEGTIGAEAAAGLYQDFLVYRDDYVWFHDSTHEHSPWGSIELYDEWTKACGLAASGGLIDFS